MFVSRLAFKPPAIAICGSGRHRRNDGGRNRITGIEQGFFALGQGQFILAVA